VRTSKGTIKAVWRVDQTSTVGKSDNIDVTADMALKTEDGAYEVFDIEFTADVGVGRGRPFGEWRVNLNRSREKGRVNVLGRNWTGPGEVMTGELVCFECVPVLTAHVDGFGLMSRSAASQITQKMGLPHCPAVFQARCGSAKGLWAASPDLDSQVSHFLALLRTLMHAQNDEPWLMVRASQHKYDCADDFKFVFEVVDYSKKSSASIGVIGKQAIQILAENGVVRLAAGIGNE
jgi:hypothetical protein